jgi:hypothetical protein
VKQQSGCLSRVSKFIFLTQREKRVVLPKVSRLPMSGRGRGRGRGRFNGRFKSGRFNRTAKSKEESNKTRKTLADYVFYIGSTKTASEFEVVSQYVINHIRKEFTYGEDIGEALEERAEVDFDAYKPTLRMSVLADDIARDKEDTEFDKIFEAQVRVYIERVAMYQSNKKKAFALIYEQCHKTLQGKLKARANYDTHIKGNPIELLNAIQEHQMSYQENRYDAAIVLDAIRNLTSTKQKEDEDLTDYTRRFKTARDVMESHLGSKLKVKKMAEADPLWSATDAAVQEQCHERAYARLIALLYIENADQAKYGTVLKGLTDQFSLNQDQYPKTVNHAMNVLSNHRFDAKYFENKKKNLEKERKSRDEKKDKSSDQESQEAPREINFAQLEGMCYCCGKKGHRSPKCPDKDKPKKDWVINKTKEAAFIQTAVARGGDAQSVISAPAALTQEENPSFGWMACGIVMHQVQSEMKDWVLLDTASTVSVFCNKEMVKQIRDAPRVLQVQTNAGVFTADKKANLPWCDMEVWFDPMAITNVISFAELQEKFPICYDNQEADEFRVKTERGVLKFTQVSKNLYVHKPVVKVTQETSLLNTVQENKKYFTDREFERAKKARNLSRALGCPSDADMKAILRLNMIKDCPVVQRDIDLAQKIFGKDIAVLKGKATRTAPKQVIHDTIEIPKALREAQHKVTLCIDTFFVNKMPFLHTISQNIHYRTSQWIPNRENQTYRKYLEVVFKVYNKAGFKIEYVCADNEFMEILADMSHEYDFKTNIASAQEHVPVVERSIRVVKERCRATIHGSPFKALPRLLIMSVVQECTRKLNFFPVKGGCSDVYSPRMILHEVNVSYEICNVPQLSYVIAHDEPIPLNSTQPRGIDGIYLRPVSNAQGGHEILNLSTNEVIQRRKVTQIPMTDDVVKAVEALAKRDSMDPFKMETKHGVILYDAATAGVEDPEEEEHPQEEDDKESVTVTPRTVTEQGDSQEEDGSVADHPEIEGVESLEEELQGDARPEVRRSARNPVKRVLMNIESTKAKKYSTQLNQVEHISKEYSLEEAKVMMMIISKIEEKLQAIHQEIASQHVITYSLKKGIQKFGDSAKEAATKEMQQMVDRKCFVPIDKEALNDVEKRRALESLIFLSEKKDGSIKARHCANGSTQREYMQREEVASPTVNTESTMLTAVIEAEEGRDVATCDIPNAFIQTEVDDVDGQGNRTILKIRGVLVGLLCQMDPIYAKFVREEKQGPVLYLHVKKAIYGMMESALLFYKKLSGDLQGYGFVINPYDPCVANKIVGGSQMTVSWHVDDLKVSHKQEKFVTEFMEWIKGQYGKIGEVKIKRGKVHEYLGMKLNYKVPGQVSIDMSEYVMHMLNGFPAQEIENKCKSPWNDDLFKVDEKSPKLNDVKREMFHTVVAQGLFLCKRARPDISPAIAFLSTRVRAPTQEDWSKLVRMMKFLKGTVNDLLTLKADGSKVLKWYTDASFAVHPDFKSQTGAIMTMGGGAVTSMSRKQGMNARSSTEAELIAADEVVGAMLWTRLFLEAQGYPVKENVLYQDNRSAMLLEKNGRQSAGRRSRHLNIRLFFVKDQQDQGRVSVQYCPTDRMIGDYMTKPLHGKKFEEFRKSIMNMPCAVQLMMAACVANVATK